MWVLIIAAGMLSLFVANSFYTDFMGKQIPWNANDTAKDIGNFHIFAAAAELYMRDHAADTAFFPTGTTVVRWANYNNTGGATVQGVSRAKGLPATLGTTNIDPTWRIHVVNSSTYYLCTGMTMGGEVKMSNLTESPLWNPAITWQQGNLTVANGSVAANAVSMVTFDVDAAGAALCKCDPTMSSGATQCH
ncbi:hypothetical protein BH11PSE12_BH11PSE12_32540 [soil metagenome]